MTGHDNLVAFKSPYDAYEHCSSEQQAWHPKWQAALRAHDTDALLVLLERYRHRVVAVFPKESFAGSWGDTLRTLGYSLYSYSEFERPSECMHEARELYSEGLAHVSTSPVHRAPALHCHAQILLRSAELEGSERWLKEAASLCAQASEVWNGEERRHLTTLGAIHRRLAEQSRDVAQCDEALATLARADVDQDRTNGDLSWALQRQTLAAVHVLKSELGAVSDLAIARSAIEDALANYELNPHNVWIKPSLLADAMNTKKALG